MLQHCRSGCNVGYYVSRTHSSARPILIYLLRMPIFELWRQATSSVASATAFLVSLVVILFFVINAMQQTASHMIMALGRDDGLIFHKQLSNIHPVLEVPVWGLLANAGCVLITGCLYLASSAAFNALINSSIILQMLSFAIPCFMLLLQRRSKSVLPEDRVFKAPEWIGWLSNVIVIVSAIIQTVFFSFPTTYPVSGSNMSKSSLVNLTRRG